MYRKHRDVIHTGGNTGKDTGHDTGQSSNEPVTGLDAELMLSTGEQYDEPSAIDNYVTSKVKAWSQSLKTLSSFAVTQPHASYAVFTHGFSNLWTFISRTTPDISNLLLPRDKIITDSLIPNLTGRLAPNHNDLPVFALPARLGGLNISLPSSSSDKTYTA